MRRSSVPGYFYLIPFVAMPTYAVGATYLGEMKGLALTMIVGVLFVTIAPNAKVLLKPWFIALVAAFFVPQLWLVSSMGLPNDPRVSIAIMTLAFIEAILFPLVVKALQTRFGPEAGPNGR